MRVGVPVSVMNFNLISSLGEIKKPICLRLGLDSMRCMARKRVEVPPTWRSRKVGMASSASQFSGKCWEIQDVDIGGTFE